MLAGVIFVKNNGWNLPGPKSFPLCFPPFLYGYSPLEPAALEFFSDGLRQRVTDLYGVAPTIEYIEIAQIVDNSGS